MNPDAPTTLPEYEGGEVPDEPTVLPEFDNGEVPE